MTGSAILLSAAISFANRGKSETHLIACIHNMFIATQITRLSDPAGTVLWL